MKMSFLIIFVLLISLTACSASALTATSVPITAVTDTPTWPTNSPGSTNTSVPTITNTRPPTWTPKPTLTMAPTETLQPSPTPKSDFVYQQNARLGRGINLGNALEAPKEGEWGIVLEEDYFVRISELGFDSVRIPVRFSNHAATESPYTIDAAFMARVDWAVENALANDLNAIVDMHHYLEMFDDPEAHRERFIEIWRQIAEHFQDAPDSVYFELLNEPNTKLDSDTWNAVIAETLPVIRASNPNRTIIVGPVGWYSMANLSTLQLPPDDHNIIVSVHFYAPFQFTHQGAEWVAGSEPWMGTTWDGTFGERLNVYQHMRDTARWGVSNDRPIFLGEFGSYQKADMESRVRWTYHVARKAEEFGMSWAYWEWCAGFGIFDPVARTYYPELVEALIPSEQ